MGTPTEDLVQRTYHDIYAAEVQAITRDPEVRGWALSPLAIVGTASRCGLPYSRVAEIVDG